MTAPIVQVTNLSVTLPSGRSIVNQVSFAIRPGELVGLIGESGSGKSTLATALLGHVRRPARVSGGAILLNGRDIIGLGPDALRAVRGPVIGHVAQDPALALDPMMRIGHHLREVLKAHFPGLSRDAVADRISTTAQAVGLPEDAEFWRRFPHELSGGQQQRVLLALAFVLKPQLIVLDEPTTALDVTTQALILKTIKALCKTHDVAALFVSHDLAVVGEIADRLMVMQHGNIVETADTAEFFARPQHPYSQMLLSAAPVLGRAGNVPTGASRTDSVDVAVLTGISKSYGSVDALRGVDLRIAQGKCTALVGESGSGKTSLARILAGLETAQTGTAELFGQQVELDGQARSTALRRSVQYIFQNPYRALNPKQTVDAILRTVARHFYPEPIPDIDRRMRDVLDRAGLQAELLDRYPGELSGGQRQRVAIARALISAPTLLICDEITSALDVSMQATILALLTSLKAQGTAIVFVTHDLAVAEEIADDVVVLYRGTVVESGPTRAVLTTPSHVYTRALLASCPRLPGSANHLNLGHSNKTQEPARSTSGNL